MNTSNPTKRIIFNKGGNIVSRQMKIFQVRENWTQQILILPMKAINNSKKMGPYELLNIFLYGVSSTSNMLPTWM